MPRDDDIIITTAYEAGTTWTRRIVAALVDTLTATWLEGGRHAVGL